MFYIEDIPSIHVSYEPYYDTPFLDDPAEIQSSAEEEEFINSILSTQAFTEAGLNSFIIGPEEGFEIQEKAREKFNRVLKEVLATPEVI